MKKVNTQIDFKEDKVCIFGKKVDIKFSSSGHYCIDIDKKNSSQADNYKIVLLCNSLKDMPKGEKYKAALKLHLQFSHPYRDKIKALLRDGEILDDELEKHLVDLDNLCNIDIQHKVKPRSCVGFSMARNFNETVAMDLKQWSNSPSIWFLHLIDHFSRSSASCVIRTKRKEIISTLD